MEPLSIGASVVGLLAAAAKVSKTLTTFINRTHKAPKLAENVLIQVCDIRTALTQLQTFINDTTTANPSRKRMLMLDQIVVTMTQCVSVFSDLEAIVNSLNTEDPKLIWARVAWTRQESQITTLLERLQWSKTSLNLMVSTLTCDAVGEAASAVESLSALVQQVLQSNQDLALRLGNLESSSRSHIRSSFTTHRGEIGDGVSTITPEPRTSSTAAENIEQRSFAFDFDLDLYQSWVYIRAMRRKSLESLPSTAEKSFVWSCLSDWSLDQVTNLSVISLPITRDHVSNKDHYASAKPPTSNSSTPRPMIRPGLGRAPSVYPPKAYSQVFPTIDTPKKRIALLGTRYSGKTTFSRQLNFLHGYELLDEERGKFRDVITRNVLEAFASIECDNGLTVEEVQNIHTIKAHTSFLESIDLEQPPNQDAVRAARALAPNPSIRRQMQLQDGTGVNANIKRLKTPLYNYFVLRLTELAAF
ncbi:MAG: hypothetical protein Q9191_006915 [Dirinaria sp. TL-2023a]